MVKQEVSSLVRSMYDLMGPNVNPPVDEAAINRHVEFSIQKLGLHQKHDQTLTYVEFHKLFSNVSFTVLFESFFKSYFLI